MDPYPIATYRLQLNSQFGFQEAIEIIPYLKRLGISHLYTSPFLEAVKGSTHGYDINNPGRINPEVGTEEELEALSQCFGILADIVPNHMAIDGNAWWADVLKHGKQSRYASYFDINWHPHPKDVGYRRFFDISSLIGVRIEDEKVFHAVLKLPIEWYQKGLIQGFRVDHPDGLRNPKEFFERLRVACPGAWIIAEKILEPGESLPDWPIDGTTGYEFMHLLNQLFVDPEGEKELSQLYEDFTGMHKDFSEIVYQSKLDVIKSLFQSEIHWLSQLTPDSEALATIAACFPVYRAFDEKTTSDAIEAAKKRRPDLKCLDDLKDVLNSDSDLAVRFKQFTGPVMAKGFEDTALYRYNRLVSLNEVGGDPSQFGLSLDDFHAAMRARLPFSLLSTSTHDTKHGEDFRARLNLLSEMPFDFQSWAEINKKHGPPDRNTEYLFYQILIGAWPIEPERVLKYLEKACREAKRYTSWHAIDLTYEKAVADFATAVMKDQEFMTELEKFVEKLKTPGYISSLSATLIKLTAPGVPDIYQGSEHWNFSLVDPDNRRPVDFTWHEHPKSFIIEKVLHFRKTTPETFTTGSYEPLYATGSKQDHIVAFIRDGIAITVVPRFLLMFKGWEDTMIALPAGIWTNLFTGETWEDSVKMKDLFDKFPIAFMITL